MRFCLRSRATIIQAKRTSAALLSAAAIMLLISPANAQDSTPAKVEDDAYITSLKSCQSIADDVQRLNCYDTAVGKVVAASDQGEVRIIDRDDEKKTKRRLFGFSLPKLGLFGDGDDEEDEIKRFQSVITNVSISGRNTVFITIEDGNAVWRINGAKPRTMRAKPGDTVEFKKASLGSYFIRINGQIGVKGRRVK